MTKLPEWITKHAPTILSVLGCAGLVATTADAIRCTNKRNAKIAKDSSVIDVIKDYGTTIALGAGTIGCVLGANVLNQKHQALLTSAYTLVAREFDQYKNKVISLCGKETDYSVEKAVAEEQRAKNEGLPGFTETQTFYFEPYGKFFESTMENVMQAEYHLNRNFILRGYVSVNDFLDFLKLEHTTSGDKDGWEEFAGEAFYGYRWIDFEHRHYTTDDGLSVCAIETPFYCHNLNEYDEKMEERFQ